MRPLLVELDGPSLTMDQKLTLLNLQDSFFLLVVLVYSICIALMLFARLRDYKWIVLVASILIVLTLSYSIYMIVEVHRILKTQERYSRVSTIFYLTATCLLFVTFVFLVLGVQSTPVRDLMARG